MPLQSSLHSIIVVVILSTTVNDSSCNYNYDLCLEGMWFVNVNRYGIVKVSSCHMEVNNCLCSFALVSERL